MATYILKTRDGKIREYWCAENGGYVYEIDEQHPGTTGRQVNERLGYTGHMMYASASTLKGRIQRARRREREETWRYE